MKKHKTSKFRENHMYYQAQLEVDIQYEKRKKRIRKVRFVMTSLFGMFLFFSLLFPYLKQKQELKLAEKTYEETAQNLKKLEKETALKEEQIANLNNDDYIADLARRDFFMSKDGEIIYSTIEED